MYLYLYLNLGIHAGESCGACKTHGFPGKNDLQMVGKHHIYHLHTVLYVGLPEGK